MDYPDFISKLQQETRIEDKEELNNLLEAALGTLGECLNHEVRDQLASELPNPLKPILYKWKDNTSQIVERQYGVEEYYNRVKARSHLPFTQASHGAKHVMRLVHEAVSEGTFDAVSNDLARDYSDLFSMAKARA
jgi:uncharacterized protein (DUF2267 family)